MPLSLGRVAAASIVPRRRDRPRFAPCRGTSNRAVTLRELVLANLGLTLMIVFWGAFFPILERLLLSWDVYSITLARQVVGTAVLYLAVLVERQRTPLPRVRSWWPILLLGRSWRHPRLAADQSRRAVFQRAFFRDHLDHQSRRLGADRRGTLSRAAGARNPVRHRALGDRRADLRARRPIGGGRAFPRRRDHDRARQCAVDLDVHGRTALAARLQPDADHLLHRGGRRLLAAAAVSRWWRSARSCRSRWISARCRWPWSPLPAPFPSRSAISSGITASAGSASSFLPCTTTCCRWRPWPSPC